MPFNTLSLDAVAAARISGGRFVRPLHGSYCFSGIPGTIQHALMPDAPPATLRLPADVLPNGLRRYDCVILLFVDAFGWHFFEQHLEQFTFLKTLARNGVVSKLTAQFPSTTTAHVTTIHTGMPPAESGLYEWNQYEPSLDAMISPLPYMFAGDRERETLAAFGNPALIYPHSGMYTGWLERGVKTTLFQHRDIEPSTFGNTLCAGAVTRTYKTVAEAVHMLADAVNARKSPHYYFWYYSGFDTLMHQYGPDSAVARAELDVLMHTLNAHLLNALRIQTGSTLLLVTADHGMAPITSETNINVNQAVPGLMPLLQRNARGDVLAPAGSARDLFLHVKPECLDEAEARIKAVVRDTGEVRRVDALIAGGYFGQLPASQRFLDRVGNLVVLPYNGHSAWWFERGKFELAYRGMHGGLSPVEMEIPLLALEI